MSDNTRQVGATLDFVGALFGGTPEEKRRLARAAREDIDKQSCGRVRNDLPDDKGPDDKDAAG